MLRKVIALAVLGGFVLLAACAAQSGHDLPKSAAERNSQMHQIIWKGGPAELVLPSGGTVSIPARARYLFGEEAKRYNFLGTGLYYDSTELMIRAGTSEIRLDYRDAGYIPDGDYCHLDFERAKKGTEARIKGENAKRKSFEDLHIVGDWFLPPSYDQTLHRLTYGRIVGSADHRNPNIFVAELTRHGYYMFIWDGEEADMKGALQPGQPLAQTIESVHPSPDDAYDRYQKGEPDAGYTVAGFWDMPETAAPYQNVMQDCR